MKKIAIIDYGLNNLMSISNAVETLGKDFDVISDASDIEQYDALILPGIGAFGDGMKHLEERGFIESIKKMVANGTPLFGICLGMQMLLTESLEFGHHKGLDLVSGKVVPFKEAADFDATINRVPHMGWNSLVAVDLDWKDTALSIVQDDDCFYFVHSFFADQVEEGCALAMCEYGGQSFCAVVKKDNVFGTQFHPEKSGPTGLRMLEAFFDLYDI